MRIEDFTAEADIVGRRLRIGWTLVPEGSETLADAPRQMLRRKTRDFEFLSPLPVPDPYLVYDSAAFPPAPSGGVTVTDVPGWETREGSERTVHEVISVADDVGGQPLERMRRTVATVLAADGRALRRRIEILDTGATPFALEPGVTYYYQLASPIIPPDAARDYRATAAPAAPHGLNRVLYDMLPGVHRQHDVVVRAATPGSASIPEAAARSGQLRRFIDVFGAAFDSTRSSAERLWTLRDIDNVDARFLPLIADWLGWRPGDVDAIPLMRNELKATPRLYESVGAPTSLRALVSRYTGWTTHLAEFAQHLVRSNDPPRFNLFVSVPSSAGWRSPLDVSEALGFGPGNREAFGLGALPATLTGANAEPFALFAGTEFTLSVDGAAEFRVRFGADDFADPAAALAAEVAAAVNAATQELVADVVAGQIRLRTLSTGPEASLFVVDRPNEILTLDAAAVDRPAVAVDAAGRMRILATDAPATPDPAAQAGEAGAPGGLVCKALAHGRWWGATRLQLPATARRAHPAMAALPDGRLFLAWLEGPEGPAATLRWSIGTSRPETSARLQGRASEPFALVPGTQMTVVTDAGSEVLLVNAVDYANPAQATAPEVQAAITAQLANVSASVAADGSIALTTAATGPDVFLRVDLAQSNAARRLGFGDLQPDAAGSWDETLDIIEPSPVPAIGEGWLSELAAVSNEDGVRLAWSEHRDGVRRIVGAAWLGPVHLIATAAGMAIRAEDGSIAVVDAGDGLPSSAVRHALVDTDGVQWVATDAGIAWRRPDLTWAVIDAAAGLADDDVRRLALAPDRSVWAATAAGASRIDAAGVIQNVTTVDGLADNDVRAVAIDRAGAVWAATAAGLSVRDLGGTWTTFAAPVLPSSDVREVAFEANGQVWVATADGLGLRSADGVWSIVALPAAAGVDVRGVVAARTGLWIATGLGAWRRDSGGAWRGWSVLEGLPSSDARHLTESSDGSVWVATAAGAASIRAGGAVSAVTLADGLPSNDVAATASAWSVPAILAEGGLANREPAFAREAAGTVVLVWSQLLPGDPGQDRRGLRAMRFDPATRTWTAPAVITDPPPGAQAADTQPAPLPIAAGATRLFFTSDRGGGRSLWECTLDPALTPGPLTPLPQDASARLAAAPVILPGGELMLIHRSDASVTPDQLSPSLAGANSEGPGRRVPEAATLRRFAGSVTPMLTDLARNGQRRQWGDLLSYTPHRPVLVGEPPLTPDDFYTRGTVGLYVSRGRFGRPLTRENADRLRQLLSEFLPINLRAVIVLTPSLTVEMVYGPGADLTDSYSDSYPFVELLVGLADLSAAALPDWAILFSNNVGNVTADPADLTTLRRRSYSPPPL